MEESKQIKNKGRELEEVKETVVDCMVNGKLLVINFDDCRVPYNKNFDINLSIFYANNMLSSYMWYPLTFFQNKCSSNHLENKHKLNKNFRLVLCSVMAFDHNLEENEITNLVEKRFFNSLPLNRINVLLVNPNNK